MLVDDETSKKPIETLNFKVNFLLFVSWQSDLHIKVEEESPISIALIRGKYFV